LKRKHTILFILLAVIVVVLAGVDILFGSVPLSAREVWGAIFNNGDDGTLAIVRTFRLTKMLTAVFVGAALSVAGLQMQTLFRNPLAGPYVLGVSSGAGLGVALLTMGLPLVGGAVSSFWLNVGAVGAAWLGAAILLAIVLAVASRIKDIMTVLVLGMMLGGVASAIVEVLQYVSSEGAVKSFVVWTMGSLGGVTRSGLAILLPLLSLGLTLSVIMIKPLNTLLLGENYARTMGLNLRRTRNMLFCTTVLLAGTATAFCGPIGFVGLAVPHIARLTFATANHRILVPASMLWGAVIMLSCDILANSVSNTITLPINTITAIVGIPLIILLVVRNKRKL
jgi:iron complex transport system permease protein